MANLQATKQDFIIPTIDLSAYLKTPDSLEAKQIVSAIREACITSGFFQVTGHGITTELQHEVLECARRLFALPLEEKEKLQSAQGRGYELIGSQTLEPGKKADMKEGYFIGPEVPLADSYRDFCHPNCWPPESLISLKAFKTPLLTYRTQLINLTRTLMEILAKGLPFIENTNIFDTFCESPLAVVRLLHYPPQPDLSDPLQVGAGAHTDFGALTLLMQDGAGGLQVLDESTKEWIDVPPNREAYVVNVGDMLQMWTGGEYRSNIHRVINKSGGDRYSVPFFFDGNLDFVLRPLDGSRKEGDGITVEEFMKERFKKTYT